MLPEATVTDAGTVRSVLLLESVTVDPPDGAVCVNVAVQRVDALWLRLVRVQVTLET